MQVPQNIRWDVTPEEAAEIQREMLPRVVEQDQVGELHHVAGVDVGFEGDENKTSRAAVVVLKFPELTLVEYTIARTPVQFPYIPGLLAFREAPVILRALEQIETKPDVIIVDGHGRAHPRHMGIACTLGVLLEEPTIGCAKSILVGEAEEPAEQVGAWTPLSYRGEVVGAAVRTRLKVTPVYVSIGNRVSLDRAIEIVCKCCKGYRLPETTRYAHRVAGGENLRLPGEQVGLLS